MLTMMLNLTLSNQQNPTGFCLQFIYNFLCWLALLLWVSIHLLTPGPPTINALFFLYNLCDCTRFQFHIVCIVLKDDKLIKFIGQAGWK